MKISEYYNWLKKDWAKAGFIISIFLFLLLFIIVRKYDFIVFLILLQTPLYMLHQTEEYIFPGGFGKFFNQDIFKLQTETEPIDETFIFFVNMTLIWIALPLFGFLSVIDYNLGLWIPYFTVFAGAAHITLGIKAKKIYNPGMIVSLVINIPVGSWTVYYLYSHKFLNSLVLNHHCAIGLGVNLFLPVIGAILFKKYMKNRRRK